MKTKPIRVKIQNAKDIEQASRELAAELQQTVTVSDVIEELTDDLENAKKRIKVKAKQISKEQEN